MGLSGIHDSPMTSGCLATTNPRISRCCSMLFNVTTSCAGPVICRMIEIIDLNLTSLCLQMAMHLTVPGHQQAKWWSCDVSHGFLVFQLCLTLLHCLVDTNKMYSEFSSEGVTILIKLIIINWQYWIIKHQHLQSLFVWLSDTGNFILM